MKLTVASSYGLHAVAYMASLKQDEPLASHIIAKKRGISDRFLLKVLKYLVNARVLESSKGPKGGYRLAKPANEISLLEILEAIDGPIRGEAPPGHKDPNHPLNKRIDQICNQVAEQMRRQLEKIKISELSARD